MTASSIQSRDFVLTGAGAALPARLYMPAAAGSARPGLLVGPGGPFKGIIESIEWLATRLAEAGFVTLTTTWRDGSPIDDPADIGIALDWLAAQPSVDSARIGMFGMSRGGMSTLRAAAAEPRLKAVATFGAPTDLLQHVRGVAHYAPGRYELLSNWLGGPPDKNRAFYETVQAFTYAGRIRQPVLSIHGGFDMHVPPEQSIWMHEALRRAGNDDAELHIIPGMSHYTDLMPIYQFGFDLVAGPAITFFQKHLGLTR